MSNYQDIDNSYKGVNYTVRVYGLEEKESVKITRIGETNTHICFWCAHKFWKLGEADMEIREIIDKGEDDITKVRNLLRQRHAKARDKMYKKYRKRTKTNFNAITGRYSKADCGDKSGKLQSPGL